MPGHFQATKKSQLQVQNWEQYSSTAVETIFFFYFHFRFMNMYFLAEILWKISHIEAKGGATALPFKKITLAVKSKAINHKGVWGRRTIIIAFISPQLHWWCWGDSEQLLWHCGFGWICKYVKSSWQSSECLYIWYCILIGLCKLPIGRNSFENDNV